MRQAAAVTKLTFIPSLGSLIETCLYGRTGAESSSQRCWVHLAASMRKGQGKREYIQPPCAYNLRPFAADEFSAVKLTVRWHSLVCRPPFAHLLMHQLLAVDMVHQ